MMTAIDSAGRVVIPKRMREAVGIKAGTPLEIRLVGDHLEIEAAPLPVKLQHRGGLLVAVPEGPRPALTHEDVKKATGQLRDERGTAKAAGEREE